MKPTRKTFLQLISGTLLASAVKPFQGYAAEPNVLQQLQQASTDEAYWSMLRKQFPLNKDLSYLNNGTMGPSPYYVIEQTQKAMMDADVNGNYGGWENATKKIAAFINTTEHEIALTRNVTEGINIIAQGLTFNKGDEVILTTQEHVGNAFPWINIQLQKGIIIRTLTPAPTAEETLQRIATLINKKTKVIAVPHILCTTGQILPVQHITKLAKSKGLFVCIDGAHGPGMLPLDVQQIGCDAYASCCHKWMLGPKGTGFLYINKTAFNLVKPMYVGAGSDDGKWNTAVTPINTGSYSDTAHRYYGGSYNAGLYKGVEASIDFLETIGTTLVKTRIQALATYLQQSLLELGSNIQMLTPTEAQSRGGIIAFRLTQGNNKQFFTDAMKEKIRIRHVAENGLDALRVSTHIYNSYNDIDRLLAFIKKA